MFSLTSFFNESAAVMLLWLRISAWSSSREDSPVSAPVISLWLQFKTCKIAISGLPSVLSSACESDRRMASSYSTRRVGDGVAAASAARTLSLTSRSSGCSDCTLLLLTFSQLRSRLAPTCRRDPLCYPAGIFSDFDRCGGSRLAVSRLPPHPGCPAGCWTGPAAGAQ